jgi:uncharacterized protein
MPYCLMTNIIQFLHEHMDNIVLSLDGRKEVNDFIRVRADGSGSYDKIVPNIKKLVALRERDEKNTMCEGTFTNIQPRFCQGCLSHC